MKMPVSYKNQIARMKEDLQQISRQLELLNGFIRSKYEKEFTDYFRISEEDSGEDQHRKLSSLTRPTSRSRKQRSRRKSSPYEEEAISVSVPIKPDEGIIMDGCCEVSHDPNNSNFSSISPADDDSFDENCNDKDDSSEISFVFETTIEYNPEEYEKDNSSGEKSEQVPRSLTTAEEVEKVPLDFDEEEDSSNSIDITEGVIKEEVVGDDLDLDEMNLDDIENTKSNEGDVDEESLPDNNNVEDDDEDYCPNSSSRSAKLRNKKKKKSKVQNSTKGIRKSGKKAQKINSSSTRFRCLVCTSKFNDESRLLIHKKRHGHFSDVPERKHKCSVCSRAFRFSSHLEDHERTHTNEKPFECPECSKTFRQASALKSHLRTHTNEKPFKCSLCKKGFRFTSNFRIHERKCAG